MTRRMPGCRSAVRVAGAVAAGLSLAGLSLDEAALDTGAAETSQESAGQPPPFVPGYRQADRVAVLSVQGMIDQVTLASLERRVAQAREEGFDAIVIDLDTPGGRVDSTRDIEHLLKTEAPVNTVAWVNPNAFSAGTLIALACREIVVHPDASWGAAAPIMAAGGMIIPIPDHERAKLEAALRADVVDSARRHGYDERLVEAFIAVGVELWMLENRQTGKRIFVDAVEYEQIFGEEPPRQIADVTPSGPDQEWTVLPWYDSRLKPFETHEQDVLTPEEIEKGIERAQSIPSSRPLFTAADRDDWNLVGQVISDDKLLVLRAEESIDYGLAQAVIRNDAELAAYFGATELSRMNMSWSEHLVRFLINGWVRAVLIAILIISIFIEMAAPGVGLFGALAGVSFLILIGAPFLVGMAEWWEILLIVIGMGLIVVEVFVLPGFGIPGIAGVLCLLVGVVGTFVSGDLDTAEGQTELMTGFIATVSALFAGGIGIWLLSKYVYDVPFFRRLILSATTDSSSMAEEDEGSGMLAAAAVSRSGGPVVGDTGVAITDLRPSGRAQFGDRTIDVVTIGGYIPAGAQVRVTSVGSFRTEVESAD